MYASVNITNIKTIGIQMKHNDTQHKCIQVQHRSVYDLCVAANHPKECLGDGWWGIQRKSHCLLSCRRICYLPLANWPIHSLPLSVLFPHPFSSLVITHALLPPPTIPSTLLSVIVHALPPFCPSWQLNTPSLSAPPPPPSLNLVYHSFFSLNTTKWAQLHQPGSKIGWNHSSIQKGKKQNKKQ